MFYPPPLGFDQTSQRLSGLSTGQGGGYIGLTRQSGSEWTPETLPTPEGQAILAPRRRIRPHRLFTRRHAPLRFCLPGVRPASVDGKRLFAGPIMDVVAEIVANDGRLTTHHELGFSDGIRSRLDLATARLWIERPNGGLIAKSL
jgi:hypothetical protein